MKKFDALDLENAGGTRAPSESLADRVDWAYLRGVTTPDAPAAPANSSRVRTAFNADYVVARVSEGETVAQVCRELDFSRFALYEWINEDPDFAKRMEAARQCGYDAIAEQVVAIADDLTEDSKSRRVRTDVRMKLLAKWHPKRYGDKLEVEQTTRQANLELPVDMDPVEAARRYQDWIKGA